MLGRVVLSCVVMLLGVADLLLCCAVLRCSVLMLCCYVVMLFCCVVLRCAVLRAVMLRGVGTRDTATQVARQIKLCL